jgi:hypothetical protein
LGRDHIAVHDGHLLTRCYNINILALLLGFLIEGRSDELGNLAAIFASAAVLTRDFLFASLRWTMRWFMRLSSISKACL